MSVIACRVYADRIEMAADSILVSGWSQRTDAKHTKLVKVRDVVVGSCGLASESGLMQLFLMTHRPKFADVDSVLEFMGEFATWKGKRINDSTTTNQYILAFDGKAFVTQEYFVDEVVNYYAIGAGQDFATAVLHLGGNPSDAVDTAIALSVFCAAPRVNLTVGK
ncbi:hypothetical protein [Paludisphaera rhizosphaerae]|uniref:hypothetical protein n=1 Tax=Paludisphaera rhizosphaerae TaxID=2711216 RepID=UPI0013EDA747|nr:hypothetical protein [Paludisphaera rhizosphaerae]